MESYTYNMDETAVNKMINILASVSLLVNGAIYISRIWSQSVRYYYSDLAISNLSYETENHAGEGNSTFSVYNSE